MYVEVENKVEGIALVIHRYSTWKGEVIHLEDLIVSASMRGKGLGTTFRMKLLNMESN